VKLNTQRLYPYLRLIEHLSRCSTKGLLNINKPKVEFPQENLIQAKIYGTVSKNEISMLLNFGTKLNINSEGDEEYLLKLLANIQDLLEEDVSYIDEEVSEEFLLKKLTSKPER